MRSEIDLLFSKEMNRMDIDERYDPQNNDDREDGDNNNGDDIIDEDNEEDSEEVNRLIDDILELRLKEHGAQKGDITASLIWNDHTDLDLHMTIPTGEEINFYRRISHDQTAMLDVDANANPKQSTLEPVENIFVKNPQKGRYKVSVNCFIHRNDEVDKIPFCVKLTIGDQVKWFKGKIGPRDTIKCFDFNIH